MVYEYTFPKFDTRSMHCFYNLELLKSLCLVVLPATQNTSAQTQGVSE